MKTININLDLEFFKKHSKKIGIITILILFIAFIGIIAKQQYELNKNLLTDQEKQLLEYANIKKGTLSRLEILRSEINEKIKEEKNLIELESCIDNQVKRIMNNQSTDVGYCMDKIQEKQQEEQIQKMDNLKQNCYSRRADMNLQGIDLENFCENPNRVGDFTEPRAPITRKVIRTDWEENDPRQDYINYIYNAIGKDGLLTFTGENTKWTLDRPSTNKGYDGNRAYGICQLYYTYHKNFINSPDFQDPYKQMDYCIAVWNDGKKRGIIPTTFQAYPGRYKWTYLFKFI